MVWSAPRTWTDGEVPTAAHFNQEVRDNFTVLKVSRADSGKLAPLSAATLADLSGANLTGLAVPAAANTFTAGVNNFNAGSGTRFVFPVGADKFDGPGSIWVEGDYLHWLDTGSTEWRYLGTFVSTPGGGALPGSGWVEGDELHYIDADSDERKVLGTGGHTDAAALSGSLWMETDYAALISSANRKFLLHLDTHSDAAHGDSHDDTGHGDSHSDLSHSDSHSDTHGDFHVDDHLDHEDSGHSDFFSDHHSDTHDDSHSDQAHLDSHSDSHDDSHTDDGHGDSHSDIPVLV